MYRIVICLILLGVSGGGSWAQASDALPGAPSYLGDIRRGPDGRLMVLPETVEAARDAPVLPAATMMVGPGEPVSSLVEAARLAKDGEVIELRPGTYAGPTVVWTQDRLILRGVKGERPVIAAEGTGRRASATWIVRGGRVRIENLEFRGAAGLRNNGVGVRLERGELIVQNCRFTGHDTALNTSDAPGLTLTLLDSELGDVSGEGGAQPPLLEVGQIERLEVRGSRFHHGARGSLIASRARESWLRYNFVADGEAGRMSRVLEFSEGGVVYLIGNVITANAAAVHPALIAYGGGRQRWPLNALYLSHNTLVNDAASGDFLGGVGERVLEGVEVWAINNLLVGHGNFYPTAFGRFEGNRRATRSDLVHVLGVPARLTSFSSLRGTVRVPGKAGDVSLLPDAEYKVPVGTQRVHMGSALAPGAFQ